jgi:N6-adenosine-specific RNA methylase IME4
MNKFGTILADPPWPYHSPKAVIGNAGRGAQDGNAAKMVQANVLQHYNVMTMEQIINLPIANLAEKNAHLYLWTTNSFLVEAHEVAKKWGFKPKTLLTWVKTKHALPGTPSMKVGYWYRSATEHILFAVRGKMRLLGPPAPTAYLLPRLPHSIKPDFFYDLIEKQSPGPYLELFARRARSGWEHWGNELDPTVNLEDD